VPTLPHRRALSKSFLGDYLPVRSWTNKGAHMVAIQPVETPRDDRIRRRYLDLAKSPGFVQGPHGSAASRCERPDAVMGQGPHAPRVPGAEISDAGRQSARSVTA
jgi:hypothetical protein